MTLTPDWVFDRSRIPDPKGRAKRMLQFAGLLRHPSSPEPGNALRLTRWQQRIIQRIYGPCNADGSRQVRTVFILLPRGNRKTALAAVLALGHTIGPEQRPGGEGILAAGSREQARKAFAEAKRFISMDSRIRSAVQITEFSAIASSTAEACRYLRPYRRMVTCSTADRQRSCSRMSCTSGESTIFGAR